jgi:hypothetical protein
MKRVLISLFIILNLIPLQACRYHWQFQKRYGKLKFERIFINEGKHSEFGNRKIFRKLHKNIEYPKYLGKIIVDTSNREVLIQINNRNINYFGDKELLGLISLGLVTPEMIDFRNNDSTGIQIHELPYLRTKNKRRFDFWIWDDNTMNPRTILIEITKCNRINTPSIKEFIKNSKVTFYCEGGIIL